MEEVVGDLDSGEDGQFENDGDDCTGGSPPAVVDNNVFFWWKMTPLPTLKRSPLVVSPWLKMSVVVVMKVVI